MKWPVVFINLLTIRESICFAYIICLVYIKNISHLIQLILLASYKKLYEEFLLKLLSDICMFQGKMLAISFSKFYCLNRFGK